MLRFVCIAAFFCCIASFATAQTPCDKVREDGKRFLRQRKYDDALNQFWAALVTCQGQPNSENISDLIKQAQEAYISDLEGLVKREQKARDEALVAKSQAENAKQLEEEARKLAEANAQRALEQGIKAESRRLALLADNVRSKGQQSDALLLAFLALKLSGDPTAQAPLMRAFGEAVRDSFSKVVFDGKIAIENIQCSPNGHQLLVKQTDQSLHLVNLGARTNIAIALPGKSPVYATWSNQGKFIATWSNDHLARLWNADGTVVATLTGHTEAVRFITFSPDDQVLVTCARDNTARLWSPTGGLLAILAGHTGNVYEAAFSQSGKYILTRSSDGTARVWDRQGQSLSTIGSPDQYLFDAKPGPSDELFITAEADGSVRCWNADGKLFRVLTTHQGAAREVLIAPKGENVMSRGTDQTVRFGAAQVEQMHPAGRALRHTTAISGFVLNSDKTRLLTWSDDFSVRSWEVVSGQLLQTFTGHKGKILAAAFCPESQLVLTSAKDGLAKLWDGSGNLLTEWIINPDHPLPAQFVSDGRHIVVADPTNHNVSLSPLPQDIFQKMEVATDLNGSQVLQLARKYNVQFLNEIHQ